MAVYIVKIMKLVIDGDSAPGLSIIESLVIKYNIDAYIYCDYTHDIDSTIKVIKIDKGYQSVDMKILSVLDSNDILITNDNGLASLALLKCDKVINSKGFIFNKNNIDNILNMNYLNKKLRNNKVHLKGPKKRTNIDDDNLYITLDEILSII